MTLRVLPKVPTLSATAFEEAGTTRAFVAFSDVFAS
jgi:hypothetical protein